MIASVAVGVRWTAADMPDQTGRTAVVTGANSGLGYETCRALAGHGARVIMAVRDADRGRAARDRLRAEVPAGELVLGRLDLADLDSVRAFAASLVAAGAPVDVLVNNAGIGMPLRSLTAQGFESQFGVNHLGHFALTGLLLPLLRRRPGARRVEPVVRGHRSRRRGRPVLRAGRPDRDEGPSGPDTALCEGHRSADRPAAVGGLDGPHRRPVRVLAEGSPGTRRPGGAARSTHGNSCATNSNNC